jgi:hypothetical protein
MDAFAPATSTRCQGAGTLTYTTTAHNNSAAIVYSLDAASVTGGNTINAATGEVSYAATWSGTTTITATAAGCNGPATATKVVTVNPTFCVSYTGDLFKNTDDPAGGTAIVNLVIEVTKSPLNSPAALNPGTFTLQVDNNTISSDKITIVTSPDGTKITYSTPYTVTLSSTNLSQSLTVLWTFSNTCEAMPACVETNAVVTVSAPANDFVTGGGYIIPITSTFNRPVINGVNNADGYKNNFGFNIKWNKTLKNLTGNWNTIIRRKEGNVVHSYQVKAKPNTLVVTQYAPGKYRADMVFTSVNFQDLTCGCWSDGGGKSSVNVTVIDNGEPGSMVDQVYILIKDKNGNTFYSSSATANLKTTFESTIPLLNKGNIQVHTIGGVKTNTLRTIDPSVTEVQPFNLRAHPNPSASSFNLQLISSNKIDKMSVRVTDITGRTVQVLHDLAPNQTLNIGAGYRPGLYMVELIQGNERKQVKLIKL